MELVQFDLGIGLGLGLELGLELGLVLELGLGLVRFRVRASSIYRVKARVTG